MTTPSRSYQTQQDIDERFKQLVDDMCREGRLILPAERTLCQTLSCSRETLRRVLEAWEIEGKILKKGRSRSLSTDLLMPKKSGRFAFIAEGFGMVGNPAWNKLWFSLSELAKKEHLSPELVLVPSGADETWRLPMESLPEVVILTTLNDSFRLGEIKKLESHTIITTEEDYHGFYCNLVAMDNYQVGFMIAQRLAEYGYKKPAMMVHQIFTHHTRDYIPFRRRVEGFLDGCAEFGLPADDASIFSVTGGKAHLIKEMMAVPHAIAAKGFDAIFLHTDNDVTVVYAALAEVCRIPEDIGLITVNSFDNAITHNPPISCCSHGTKLVANELIRQIKRLVKKPETTIGKILIPPLFYDGQTLPPRV